MENNTRQIVILNRLKSPCIEQAIFILRDGSENISPDAVNEAQKIVDSYIEQLQQPLGFEKRHRRVSLAVNSLVFLSAAIIISALILSFFR